jgi:hypothetical protein
VQAQASVEASRHLVQLRIVELGHASHVEKIQRARLVTAALIELLEAQGTLERALVAEICALKAAAAAKESPDG